MAAGKGSFLQRVAATPTPRPPVREGETYRRSLLPQNGFEAISQMSKQPKPDATPDKRPAWVRWATNKQERFRTHYKLPFELLAQTAAQLLAGEGPAEGDDAMMHVHPPKHYYRIAERALMLLHACADTIGGNAHQR